MSQGKEPESLRQWTDGGCWTFILKCFLASPGRCLEWVSSCSHREARRLPPGSRLGSAARPAWVRVCTLSFGCVIRGRQAVYFHKLFPGRLEIMYDRALESAWRTVVSHGECSSTLTPTNLLNLCSATTSEVGATIVTLFTDKETATERLRNLSNNNKRAEFLTERWLRAHTFNYYIRLLLGY